MRESLMLTGVSMEIDEWIERYNDMLWRPYALFPPFCYRPCGHEGERR